MCDSSRTQVEGKRALEAPKSMAFPYSAPAHATRLTTRQHMHGPARRTGRGQQSLLHRGRWVVHGRHVPPAPQAARRGRSARGLGRLPGAGRRAGARRSSWAAGNGVPSVEGELLQLAGRHGAFQRFNLSVPNTWSDLVSLAYRVGPGGTAGARYKENETPNMRDAPFRGCAYVPWLLPCT